MTRTATATRAVRSSLALALALGATAAAPDAFAQAPPPQAQADALFSEGRDLLEKGRYTEACAKLAKSEELAPAVGTLLNLAYCWEQAGRLKSALDAYSQAEAFASAAGETKRAIFAKERYAAVEPRTTKLVVRLTAPEAPGLEVKRNGVAMAKADLDRPTAVDPADYTITASAPGHVAWRGAIVVKGEGGVVTMIVPPLTANEKVAAAPRTTAALGTRHIAALGLGGLSALALGAGVGLAFAAKSRYEDASSRCDDAGCDDTGHDIQSGAVAQGNIATGLIGLGLLSAGAGIYLWIVGGPESAAAAPAFVGGRF